MSNELYKETDRLKAQVEDMKCCGNCAHRDIECILFCEHTGNQKYTNQICNYWQSDSLTREQREK
jgi:hypothetical protein